MADNTLQVSWQSRPYRLKCREVKWNWYAVPANLKPSVSHSKFLPASPIIYSEAIQGATLSYSAAGGYTFDIYVGPNGDDTLGNGTVGNPYSSSALTTKVGWTTMGFLPGVYTRNSVTDAVGQTFNQYATATGHNGGHTVPSNVTVASCDSFGNYSPRTALLSYKSPYADKYTGQYSPRQDVPVLFGANSGANFTIDGLEFEYGSQGFSCSGATNAVLQNSKFSNFYAGYQPNNVSTLSFGGLACNNVLVYNTWINKSQCTYVMWATVGSITSTGCTLLTLNGIDISVGTGNGDGWPLMSNPDVSGNSRPVTITFVDTAQSISSVTCTKGSQTITWPSHTISGTPNGRVLITTNNVAPPAGWPNAASQAIYQPWGIYGGYTETVGHITPFVWEGCTFQKMGWNGNKTSAAQTQWKRCYAEQCNFGYYNDPPGNSISPWALTGINNPDPSHLSIMDHCIVVGFVNAYGAGSIDDNPPGGAGAGKYPNTVVGTLNINHCTIYTPLTIPQVSGNNVWGAVVGIAITQFNATSSTPAIIHTNNLYASSILNGVKFYYPQCAFTGHIAAGTSTLTLDTGTTGQAVMSVGMNLYGAGVLANTTLVALLSGNTTGAGSTWQVSNVHPGGVPASTAMTTSFGPTPNWGQLTSDYNGTMHAAGLYSRSTSGAGAPNQASYAFYSVNTKGGAAGTWPVLTGQDTHSFYSTDTNVFTSTPATGDVISFSIRPAHDFATASSTGGPIGAIDGTLGRNGVACGCNFWVPDSLPTPNQDLFPRAATYPIGGNQATAYSAAGWNAWAAKHSIVIYGWYTSIETAMTGGKTLASVSSAQIAQGQLNRITSRPIPYLMQQQLATAYNNGGNSQTLKGLINAANTNNWWVRTSPGWPSGSIVAGDTAASGLINNGRGGPNDSGTGKTINQFWPYYGYNVLTQGNGVALFGETNSLAVNPNWVGVFMDNQLWAPRANGSWSWGVSGTYNQNSAGAHIVQAGYSDMVAAWRAIWPTALVCGNSDYGTYTITNGGLAAGNLYDMAGLYDVALCESFQVIQQFMGFGSTTTGAFGALCNGEAVLTPIGSQVVVVSGRKDGSAWTSTTSQATWTSVDWTSVRYFETMTWLRDAHVALAFNTSYDSVNMTGMWSDDYDKGAGKYGWLGPATDPPQTSAQFPGGVWGRHFANGLILCNPVGNGSKTVTLPNLVYYTLLSNGKSDPAVNTHAQVNSVTLADGDGIVLSTSL